MKFRRAQYPVTIPYAASSPAQQVLQNLNFWPTGFWLDLELAKTDAASPTTYQDFLMRAIQGLTILGDSKTYVSITGLDLRPYYWYLRMLAKGRFRGPDMAAGSVTFRFGFPILLGVHPILADDEVNWYDTTAAIKPTSDLTFTVNWAAATALGTNRTIGTGTVLRITPFGVIPETTAEYPTYYPYFQTVIHQPTQAFSGEGDVVQLTTGQLYARSLLMFLNGASPADNRTDGNATNAVSEVALIDSNNQKILDEKVWDFAQRSQGAFLVADDNAAVPGAALAGGASTTAIAYNAGVGLNDYRRILDPSHRTTAPDGQVIGPDPTYGLDLNNKLAGAASYGFTVDASTNTKVVFMHAGYKRY